MPVPCSPQSLAWPLGPSEAPLGLSVSTPSGSAGRTYLDAGGREVGNLKLDADWGLAFLVLCLHAGQAKAGPHQVLFATLGEQTGWRWSS